MVQKEREDKDDSVASEVLFLEAVRMLVVCCGKEYGIL
jgi:hypothetical protein